MCVLDAQTVRPYFWKFCNNLPNNYRSMEENKPKNSFIGWCRRYISLLFVGLLALYVYVLFFNDNSYGHLRELHGEIKRLEKEKKENQDTLNKYYELNRLLLSDKEELERVAREKYGMQRPGEDVYIIE